MDGTVEFCNQYAEMVNGKPDWKKGVCSVDIGRKKLSIMIEERPSKSAAVAGITFESLDAEGNALNLAEVAVTQDELTTFVQALARNGLTVSAIHNHWIFTSPPVLYVHVQSVEPPLSFAKKFSKAFRVLTD